MATTAYSTSDAETVKIWERKILQEIKKKTYFDRFINTSSDSIIQLSTDLQKQKGDQISFVLRMQVEGKGALDDTQLANSGEVALSTHVDSVVLHQLRQGIQSAGAMTDQRTYVNIKKEAILALIDWFSTRLDVGILNQLAGMTSVTDIEYTGCNAVTAPDANHWIIAGGGSPYDETVLDSADTFDLSYVDQCVALAKTLTPAIRPVNVDGKSYYVMFIHPYQEYDLRRNEGGVQWAAIQKSLISGGKSSGIFDGSLGVYNNVILHSSANVPSAVANTRRAVFCGAQAGLMGYGSYDRTSVNTKDTKYGNYKMIEESYDYNNRTGIAVASILGMKKAVFNSEDLGTIVVSTWAASPIA